MKKQMVLLAALVIVAIVVLSCAVGFETAGAGARLMGELAASALGIR